MKKGGSVLPPQVRLQWVLVSRNLNRWRFLLVRLSNQLLKELIDLKEWLSHEYRHDVLKFFVGEFKLVHKRPGWQKPAPGRAVGDLFPLVIGERWERARSASRVSENHIHRCSYLSPSQFLASLILVDISTTGRFIARLDGKLSLHLFRRGNLNVLVKSMPRLIKVLKTALLSPPFNPLGDDVLEWVILKTVRPVPMLFVSRGFIVAPANLCSIRFIIHIPSAYYGPTGPVCLSS